MSLANPSRRGFLKAGGLLLVTVNLPAPLLALAEQGATDLPLDQVDSFIAIAADGKVTAFCGHVDLGTGIRTALAQIVAEELDVAFEQVEMILGDTRRTPDQGPTIASASIQVSAVPLRQAAAEARRFLLRQAGSHFPVHPDSLRSENGQVFAAANPQRRIGYGELLRGQRFNLNIDGKAPLKPRSEYRLVGKPVRRVDIPAKLTGQLTYVHDMRLPGMLHGRVVRPPYTGADVSAPLGSGLLAVDESSVAGLPGLVKVVVIGDFVGVVCEREEQAIRAARQLKVRWKDWQGLPPLEPDRLEDTLRRHPKKPRTLHDSPGLEQHLAGIARPLSATYVWPYQLHASIGPSCALAEVDAQRARVWSGTQNPHDLRNDLARLLQRETGDIEVIRMEAAGCYGRNGADGGPAGAGTTDARTGTWLGTERHRATDRGPRRSRRARPGGGLRLRHLLPLQRRADPGPAPHRADPGHPAGGRHGRPHRDPAIPLPADAGGGQRRRPHRPRVLDARRLGAAERVRP